MLAQQSCSDLSLAHGKYVRVDPTQYLLVDSTHYQIVAVKIVTEVQYALRFSSRSLYDIMCSRRSLYQSIYLFLHIRKCRYVTS